jgi:hypothetical protein
MSPRHFARYAEQDPKGYQTFTDNMWNGFVSVTKHIPVMGRFFSFTPDFLQGLDAKAIGKQLGEVYSLTMTDNPVTGSFADGEIPGDKDQTL